MMILLLIVFIGYIIVNQYYHIFKDFKHLQKSRQNEGKKFVKKVCNRKWKQYHMLVIFAGLCFLSYMYLQDDVLQDEYFYLYVFIVILFTLDIGIEMLLAKELQNIYHDEHSFFARDKCYRFKQIKGYRNKLLLQKVEIEVLNGEKIVISKEQFKGIKELLEEYRPSYKLRKIG